MEKLIKTILILIWIIDILNIGITICGVNVAEFLDVTVPINTLEWWLIWILIL